MLQNTHDWLNILVRWAHLITGIMWIGSSFYFMWLDSHLEAPKKPKEGVEGELWMVHSGGFYQVEKYLIKPGFVPDKLHWFKWEATFTWITGFMLLWIVYYTTGGIYLVDPNIANITSGQGTAIGLSLLVGSWFFYDLLFRSKLGKTQVGNAIALAFVGALAYGLTHVFSGRAAYLHIGAMFGTWMVVNVWVHILPNQQKMIDATKRGEIPDYNLGKIGKARSVHNSYMTLPVLFIMISNHYPSTYGHQANWLVLLILIFLGAMVRHGMIIKKNWPYIPAAVSLLVLMFMTSPKDHSKELTQADLSELVPMERVTEIVQNRCVTCHSANPSDDIFKVAPNGIMFDDMAVFSRYSARVLDRVVINKTMPLMNKTNMTDDERTLIARWIKQQNH